MAGQKWNLNTIYISERLKACLRPVSQCAMTTVVAPMGYGKTTAVNWYLEQYTKEEKKCVIRISVYSDNLAIFWRSVQMAFLRAGFDFLQDYMCPEDAQGSGLLVADLCHVLAGCGNFYIFIDDFHLLTDRRATVFLCMLANCLPGNVHLIVASRNQFLSAADILRLGGKVYQMGTEQLRLNHKELAVYVNRCGMKLSDTEIEQLLYASEGWFSAVYLNLQMFLERGMLPDEASDIYTAFTEVMIQPLSEKQQEFLAVMGLADEFSAEMARYVTADEHAEEILHALTVNNAFVKRLADGVTFRFHHMMKECAGRVFAAMDQEKQMVYLDRFGAWYENHRQYLHAMHFYWLCRDSHGWLRVVQEDAGILLASLNAQEVIEIVDACPAPILKAHPFAILVLMRSMFNWHQIPKMMALKTLLTEAVEENSALTDAERGNLLGECDLIMSFLCYNDIGAMSRLHRSASSRMSRPAISIHNSGGWTFGSPSVLMMFYRGPGQLESELQQMDACMPHYYKITCGHGQGAETIMRAEAAFMQGHFTDAQIALEQAYVQIEGNGQENMALCCDFLAWRMSLATTVLPEKRFEARYKELLKHHNTAWLNIWHAILAYYHALIGKQEAIPTIFASHRLNDANILVPGKPMHEMIENQVYLVQGAYVKVIGRSDRQLAVCESLHYALVALHIRIQTAAAYEALGKWKEAQLCLNQALQAAEPDHLLMPFVENYVYLKRLLALYPIKENRFVSEMIALGKLYDRQISVLQMDHRRPEVFTQLTEREYEIVQMMAQRLTNREIADQLFLSEGSVKQYVKQIYAKLQIEGDTRTKRQQLFKLLENDD